MAYRERISVNLDVAERKKLEHLANENDVTLAWMTRRALKSYLATLNHSESLTANDPGKDDDVQSSIKTLGWKEWISLPAIGVPALRAKVDTGARTSALNAQAIEPFEQNGQNWVRFTLQPDRRHDWEIECTAPVTDIRSVKDSGGHSEERFVIETTMRLGVCSSIFLVEITLANRSGMQFAMLLGRTAIRRRFAVDPARSFVTGVPIAAHRSKRKRALA